MRLGADGTGGANETLQNGGADGTSQRLPIIPKMCFNCDQFECSRIMCLVITSNIRKSYKNFEEKEDYSLTS